MKKLLNLERVEKVLREVHGVLHPLHQQVGGVHGQVGQGVVTLSQFFHAEIPKVNKKKLALWTSFNRLTIISWKMDFDGLGVGLCMSGGISSKLDDIRMRVMNTILMRMMMVCMI